MQTIRSIYASVSISGHKHTVAIQWMKHTHAHAHKFIDHLTEHFHTAIIISKWFGLVLPTSFTSLPFMGILLWLNFLFIYISIRFNQLIQNLFSNYCFMTMSFSGFISARLKVKFQVTFFRSLGHYLSLSLFLCLSVSVLICPHSACSFQYRVCLFWNIYYSNA